MKKKLIKTNTVLLILLFLAYIGMQILLQKANLSETLGIYKGVFTSLQYGICLLMVMVDLRKGSRLGLTLMGLSVLALVLIVARGAKDAVPGLFNAVFFMITIIAIVKYDTWRDIESRTDSVTRLFNRRGLYRALQDKTEKNHKFDIAYISISNMRAINDTYGHAYGDELLRKISERIKARMGRECIAARVGGAEFVIVLESTGEPEKTAECLLDMMREKTTLVVDDNSVEWYIDVFAGIASYPENTTDYEELIKYADIAVTEAKANKTKAVTVFDVKMLSQINRQIQLKSMIKEGLDKDYLYLVYQPQYEIKEKKIRGFEALVRMKTSQGEVVSPAEFIPVAEKSDLILQIDDYVLDRAMREFKDIVLDNPELTISINVSAKNFADVGFVEKVVKTIDRTGFPSRCLEIEITEYCMVNSIDQTTANINALRALGVKIALDDFGTGYTALNYVATLPFDLLKIDKSLIDDIENEKKRRDFVKAIITMGQLMECEIIAEGVENDSQIHCLKQDGLDYVQGFVWNKPLPYEDAKKLALYK